MQYAIMPVRDPVEIIINKKTKSKAIVEYLKMLFFVIDVILNNGTELIIKKKASVFWSWPKAVSLSCPAYAAWAKVCCLESKPAIDAIKQPKI